MRVSLLLAAAAVAALLSASGAGAAAHADPVLTGDVGANDAYVIALTDASGSRVTHLDPGTYTLVVHDHSVMHDFHLTGPGVDVATGVDFVGDQTFTVTIGDGQYFYVCDPHASRMKGTFTAGSFVAPTKTTPAKMARPAAKLSASIGPGAVVRLSPSAPRAGKAVVTVSDRTSTDGFRLSGPGVAKATSATFRGTVRWTVTLRPGTYSYGSAKSAKKRRSFTVSAA